MSGFHGHNWRNAKQHDLADLRNSRDSLLAVRSLASAESSRRESDLTRMCWNGSSRILEGEARLDWAHDRERSARRETARLRDEIAELQYDLGDDGYDDIDGD